METVIKSLPYAFMYFPFINVRAELSPRSGTEENITCALTYENVVPVFVFVTTKTACFVLTSIASLPCVCAPKAVQRFCCYYLTCSGKFVECDAKGVPCN
jgi:hypothetical protein